MAKALEVVWQEADRLAAVERARDYERYQANMRQRDEMLRGWEEDRLWRLEHEQSSQPVAEACLLCSGSGLYASNDIFGQSTVYLQGTPGSPPQPVTVSRPAGPRFNTCPVWRGTGKR